MVVGIKGERERPGEIEGAQALFVVNLPPRKMAGVLSEAMLFDLGYSDGIAPRSRSRNARSPTGRGRAETAPPGKCPYTDSIGPMPDAQPPTGQVALVTGGTAYNAS